MTAWVTYSIFLIQVVTWIHTGSLDDPDPITLLISSITGNFLHDPVYAKRAIMLCLGLGWLLITGWAFTRSYDYINQKEESWSWLNGS
jgi:hypothetical protein